MQASLSQTFVASADRLWHCAWSRDGTLLAACGADKVVRLFAVDADARLALLSTLEDAQTRTIRSCEFSPSGQYLATASFDGSTAIWARQGDGEWETIATLEGHENEVKSVAWNASGTLLSTCGRDKTVWIWQVPDLAPIFNPDAEELPVREWECVSVLSGHSADVKMVRFHPHEDLLVSCSYDDCIRVWIEDVDDWSCEAVLTGHTNTVWGVAFVDDDAFASCSQDLSIRVWRRSSGRWLAASSVVGGSPHSRTIFSIDFAQGILVTGGGDDALCFFSLSSADVPVLQARVDHAHEQDVNCVRWCPTRPGLLATAGDDGAIRLWNCQMQPSLVMQSEQ